MLKPLVKLGWFQETEDKEGFCVGGNTDHVLGGLEDGGIDDKGGTKTGETADQIRILSDKGDILAVSRRIKLPGRLSLRGRFLPTGRYWLK